MGEHRGLQFHTQGQRGGLSIGGRKGGSGEPWYVAAKSIADNALIVVQGDHPALYGSKLTTETDQLDCRGAALPPNSPARRRSAIDRLTRPAACGNWTTAAVSKSLFEERQRAITPGQSVVFYDGEVCLGGGVIKASDAYLGGL
jgi:tRNA-specific 2-thiouridylase